MSNVATSGQDSRWRTTTEGRCIPVQLHAWEFEKRYSKDRGSDLACTASSSHALVTQAMEYGVKMTLG